MGTVPRRGRFQIHLSTAVVLMFVAGGIIWANVHKNESVEHQFGDGCPALVEQTFFGWPMNAYRSHGYFTWGNTGTGLGPQLYYTGISVDALAGFGLLSSTWFVCEWLIRRRAARKGD